MRSPRSWPLAAGGLFGGHLDPGETPEQALRRELLEEISWQPHGGAGPAAAAQRDVEGCAPPANGDRAEAPLGEVEAQRAKACRAAKAEAHGDQRLLTQ
jgi:hypothetical protein